MYLFFYSRKLTTAFLNIDVCMYVVVNYYCDVEFKYQYVGFLLNFIENIRLQYIIL